MGSIFVLNTNAEDHQDRYDGEDYLFPGQKKGEPPTPILIPKVAATHMFGWNMKDKSDILVRLGWATRYDPAVKNFVENPDGIKRLQGFLFDEVATVQKSTLEKRKALA